MVLGAQHKAVLDVLLLYLHDELCFPYALHQRLTDWEKQGCKSRLLASVLA